MTLIARARFRVESGMIPMALPIAGTDDRHMQDEGSTALGAAPASSARRLERRTSDRVIAGVAGGVGDYLNVDPVLIRAAFAGLMIFGGAGLVLYVALWLFMPTAGERDSIVESGVRWTTRRGMRTATVVLIVLAVVFLTDWMTGGGYFSIEPAHIWAIAAIVVGAAFLLGRSGGGATRSADPSAIAEGAQAAAGLQAAAGAEPRLTPVAEPGERSALPWLILGSVLLAVAALAVAGAAGGIRVAPSQYVGAAFVVAGVGLAIGSWWGHARRFILLGLLALPLAIGSAFVTVPLEGGAGDHYFHPIGVAELQPEYRLVGGRLWLDLTDLPIGTEPVTINASVGVGELIVVVPQGANLEVDARVDAGALWLLGSSQTGTGLSDRLVRGGNLGRGFLILTLDAGIGSVDVERSSAAGS
jgi:phage shock protein PspC (stress-responsive transcriptional regulator)